MQGRIVDMRLMGVNIGRRVIQWAVKPRDIAVLGPVDGFRRDCVQIIFGFCPGAPGGIFQPHRVCNVTPMGDNVPPAGGNIGFLPIV